MNCERSSAADLEEAGLDAFLSESENPIVGIIKIGSNGGEAANESCPS